MRLTRASSERSTPSRAMITRQGSGPAKSLMKSNSVRSPRPSINHSAMSATCGRMACMDLAWKTRLVRRRSRVWSGGSLNTIHCDR